MAFDFPDLPAVGDEYVSGGCKYTWTGLVWDLSGMDAALDYVQTTGDTMTGKLNIDTPGVDGSSLNIRSELGVKTISLNPSGPPHSGLIEFWDPAKPDTRKGYIGYGGGTDVASYYININPEGGKVHINGGGLAMQDGAGIHWGSTSAKSSHTDLSEGICLYGWGGTSKFGFNITSGTLGYCVENAANRHCFTVGGAEKVVINNADGLHTKSGVPAKFYGPTSFETGSHIEMNNTIIYCDSDSTYDGHVLQIFRQENAQVAQTRGYGGSSEGGVRFHCNNGGYGWCDNWRSNVVSGGGLYVGGQMSAGEVVDRGTAATKRDIRDCNEAEIKTAFAALKPKRFVKLVADPVDENGQPLPKDQCWPKDERLRFGFVVDDIVANPATKDIAGYSVIPGTNGQQEPIGTDVMQVLALAVAKIKLLEAEIELLKKRK